MPHPHMPHVQTSMFSSAPYEAPFWLLGGTLEAVDGLAILKGFAAGLDVAGTKSEMGPCCRGTLLPG